LTHDDLPDYQGCLNLLHAIYSLWWRDAQSSKHLLEQLADWTDQSIEQALVNRPMNFRSFRKSDLYDD
jgi:hypothetical protein